MGNISSQTTETQIELDDEDVRITNFIKKINKSEVFSNVKILQSPENKRRFADVLTNPEKLKEKYLTFNWEELLKKNVKKKNNFNKILGRI
jgi:predicted ABC-type exoprotein transport system permease subunit